MSNEIDNTYNRAFDNSIITGNMCGPEQMQTRRVTTPAGNNYCTDPEATKFGQHQKPTGQVTLYSTGPYNGIKAIAVDANGFVIFPEEESGKKDKGSDSLLQGSD